MSTMDPSRVAAVLDDPWAHRLYAATELARLSYTAEDGSPRVVPIGYVRRGTEILLFTTPNAAKVRSLRADPRVALTIDTNAFPPLCLLLRGEAVLEEVDGVPDDYVDSNRQRTTPEEHAAWEAGVRALYDRMVRIAVTPTWAKLLDFETRLPSAVAELQRQKAGDVSGGVSGGVGGGVSGGDR